tara:strand:- start:69 stop:236 length:168 start_codon:yes stop_codon:yes gene_type:complete
MNELSEHRAMSSIIQNRVTEYADNMTMLLDRIAFLESKIKELEQKIADVNDIEYY